MPLPVKSWDSTIFLTVLLCSFVSTTLVLLIAPANQAPVRVPAPPLETHQEWAGDNELCWSSAENGGYAISSSNATLELDGRLQRSSASQHSRGGVTVSGTGCRSCVAGASCSFVIRVQPPANWAWWLPPRQWELMVLLKGPTLLAPEVKQLPPLDGSVYRVTYQTWDPGFYRVAVRSSCGMLNYTAEWWDLKGHELAAWNTTVLPAAPPGEDSIAWIPHSRPGAERWSEATATSARISIGDRSSSSSSSIESSSSSSSSSSSPTSSSVLVRVDQRPCATSDLPARWVRTKFGHRWLFFPCAQAVGPQAWVVELNRRGVWEVSFVGDSHQRVLLHHLLYLLDGRTDPPNRQAHTDLTYDVHNTASGGRLRLNFYWMAGVYDSGTDFGCSKEGRGSSRARQPELSRTTDVLVFEAGYWGGVQCKSPEEAFAAYLPSTMQWLSKASRPHGMQGAHHPLLIYRSTPPRATDHTGCSSLTNVYVQYANDVARGLVPLVKGLFLNLWDVEAPRYLDHCPKDHHYSCVDDRYVWGEVGEADVFTLVNFILWHRPIKETPS